MCEPCPPEPPPAENLFVSLKNGCACLRAALHGREGDWELSAGWVELRAGKKFYDIDTDQFLLPKEKFPGIEDHAYATHLVIVTPTKYAHVDIPTMNGDGTGPDTIRLRAHALESGNPLYFYARKNPTSNQLIMLDHPNQFISSNSQ
jgi:hypothetical protein